jgi:hypothetical protein
MFTTHEADREAAGKAGAHHDPGETTSKTLS